MCFTDGGPIDDGVSWPRFRRFIDVQQRPCHTGTTVTVNVKNVAGGIVHGVVSVGEHVLSNTPVTVAVPAPRALNSAVADFPDGT